LRRDFRAIWAIAFPAILTQLATPFTVAYTTYAVAPYGTDAVSASAIIGRIVPVAFGIIFSLSGAVGPIIGQNFGAKDFGRVRQTLWDGLTFAAIYTLITSALLWLFREHIADAFHLTGEARAHRHFLLHMDRHHLGLRGRAVRGQCRFQQSRAAGAFHVVQLGQGHARHHPLRHRGQHDRAGRRHDGGDWRGLNRFWHCVSLGGR
jgi:hypothetical protein